METVGSVSSSSSAFPLPTAAPGPVANASITVPAGVFEVASDGTAGEPMVAVGAHGMVRENPFSTGTEESGPRETPCVRLSDAEPESCWAAAVLMFRRKDELSELDCASDVDGETKCACADDASGSDGVDDGGEDGDDSSGGSGGGGCGTAGTVVFLPLRPFLCLPPLAELFLLVNERKMSPK